MSTEEWTLLVQRVDSLIKELKHTRSQSNQWRTKCAELERLHLGDDRQARLDAQAKDRELEQLRKERKKIKSTIAKSIEKLNLAESRILENSQNE